jgi:hypothetical protein
MMIVDAGLLRAMENHERHLRELKTQAMEKMTETMATKAMAAMCYDPKILGPLDWMK